jgi:hypothetical protein
MKFPPEWTIHTVHGTKFLWCILEYMPLTPQVCGAAQDLSNCLGHGLALICTGKGHLDTMTVFDKME